MSGTAVERVREDIVALISRLGLRPGDRLTTEAELAELFGVSRPTVREALKLLEQEGLVSAIRGHGRFIAAEGSLRVERPMTKYESITEMLTRRGHRVSTAVLSVSETGAGPIEADSLEIAEGDPVIRLLRIRYGDDRPMVVSENVIARDALPGPIGHRDWSGSLTVALAAHGHRIQSSVATVSAVELPAEWAATYDLGGLDPWLLVTEVGLTRRGQRVLFAKDYHRGDEITFAVIRHA